MVETARRKSLGKYETGNITEDESSEQEDHQMFTTGNDPIVDEEA